jgi:ferric-dicitrate binding protein FerR (iron transport regulator)
MIEKWKTRWRHAAKRGMRLLFFVLNLIVPKIIPADLHFRHATTSPAPSPPVTIKTVALDHFELSFNRVVSVRQKRDSAGRSNTFVVKLRDGTRVRLGFCSSLQYDSLFTRNNRHVVLNGQAEFEVAHDPTHPLIIETSHSTIQVLGTHLHVSDFGGDASCEVTLLSGAVNVSHNGRTLSLKQLQRAVINEGKMLTRHPEQPDRCLGWTQENGFVYFDNTDLATVLQEIGRWYNVTIVNPEKLTGIPVSGPLDLKLPLDNILSTLKLTELGKARFIHRGNSVIVRSSFK